MYTVLMTASVLVTAPFTVVSDPIDRSEQYFLATAKWLLEPSISQVVFCENTGHSNFLAPLQLLAKEIGKRLELLVFKGDQEKIKKYGKGYGEGEIISYALANSQILQSGNFFLKINGRLYVDNFAYLATCLNPDSNYFKLMATRLRTTRQVDTRFYYVQKQFYIDHLESSYENVFDGRGRWLEHIFYERLKPLRREIESFPVWPLFKGVSGSQGTEYQQGHIHASIRDFLNSLGMYRV